MIHIPGRCDPPNRTNALALLPKAYVLSIRSAQNGVVDHDHEDDDDDESIGREEGSIRIGLVKRIGRGTGTRLAWLSGQELRCVIVCRHTKHYTDQCRWYCNTIGNYAPTLSSDLRLGLMY
ncbi:hypothetical protein KQX54_008102 [Cotesia glomerata]|uniref:Uncharacterized protein n=1 Tax=Cotesia glomerata TaxID=32391 RepID=A0AAV7IRA5_COTGL|nr:hypothetical protein KQX54_008102 [Cotesia glomerata]